MSNTTTQQPINNPTPTNSPNNKTTNPCEQSPNFNSLYELHPRLEIPENEAIELIACSNLTISGGGNDKDSKVIHLFASTVKSSGDLLLICDHDHRNNNDKGWTLKQIPWFDSDPSKRISALTFDEDILFLGTWDGTIYELRTRSILLSNNSSSDLIEITNLNGIKITSIVIYNQDSNKIILCSGAESGKFIILTNHAPPVLVTFTSGITGVELFINKGGLTCALVCLSSGQNVYTVLDDMDLSSIESSSGPKRSLFKKAKDNLMSRLSEDKLNFFKKKDTTPSTAIPPQNSSEEDNAVMTNTSNTTVPSLVVGHDKKPALSNVKFQTIEEISCKDLIRKVINEEETTLFYRHQSNKLDIFDSEFRQMSTTYTPGSIRKVFPIHRLYFSQEENNVLKVNLIVDSVLKDFTQIDFNSNVITMEPNKKDPNHSSVFILAENGIHELKLKKSPMETCIQVMLSESNILDPLCQALDVKKAEVCVKAGDIRSEEGKFSKTIIYYKLAGLTYPSILAKFGTHKNQIPAMLFFFELVDQDRSKFGTKSLQEREVMADLALVGRVEQWGRYGHGMILKSDKKGPEPVLRKMLKTNQNYSSLKACQYMAIPELLWALKIVAESRLCYPQVLESLSKKETELAECQGKKLFWKLLTQDWLSIYSIEPQTFNWFRSLILNLKRRFTNAMVSRLLILLIPWRRELQRKMFLEVNDFLIEQEDIPIDDYVTLFIILLLEAIRRNLKLTLPSYLFKYSTHSSRKEQLVNHKHNMVATVMLSTNFSNTFAASSNHCAVVRNGRVYTWGENKQGRLGIPDCVKKQIIDTPTLINVPPPLKIYVQSVSCGHTHTVALTSVGTLLVFGSNKYGQLGLGPKVAFTTRPVPIDLPNVIFLSISAGSYHTVAVDHLNRVWSWGWGVYGQLGNGSTENVYKPKIVRLQDKIVSISTGHSHTALLTCYGRVLITGCNHFGQLGLGFKNDVLNKVKVPTLVEKLPEGTLVRNVSCGICCTVFVTMKNRVYYTGINPASLKSLLNTRKNANKEKVVFEEEKDFNEPIMIDTSHVAGDITKVSCSSTHFSLLTSLSYVYTWGIGKSGQLGRNDDEAKTLELIENDNGSLLASDIASAGDCTFLIEKETGILYGCGFNNSGQLGQLSTLNSEDNNAIISLKTKKRIVKLRQPANIYFRFKEVHKLVKEVNWDGDEEYVLSNHRMAPSDNQVGEDLLFWCLRVFKRNYDKGVMVKECLSSSNIPGASLIETLSDNHEDALRHDLEQSSENLDKSEQSVDKYFNAVKSSDHINHDIGEAYRSLTLLIRHWSRYSLPPPNLENLLMKNKDLVGVAMREVLKEGGECATWITANLTPVFLLGIVKDGGGMNNGEVVVGNKM